MLHHLQGGAKDGLAEVGVAVPERTLEAVGPAAEPGSGGDQLALVLFVGDDLSKLDLDILGRLGLATEAGEGSGGRGNVATLDEVARRIGQEEETAGENDSPDELDGDGNAVCASVWTALGTVDHTGSKHDTNGDAELVAGNQGATNFAGALEMMLAGKLQAEKNKRGGLQFRTCTK